MDKLFPALLSTGYKPTSPPTPEYNCIAWAADEDDVWWWPDVDSYWPPDAPRELTINAFICAYATLGYEVCDGAQLEAGFRKIAIYAQHGYPTHAAKQLPSGKWSSKLGKAIDIEHDLLEGVCGPVYGTVAVIMRKPT